MFLHSDSKHIFAVATADAVARMGGSTMSVSRLTRLNALLQRELGALMKFHISPELKNTLVTITGVKVTSNLREASVYYSVFSQDANAEEKVASLLQAKRVQLQSDLAARVVMKYTPVLHFRYDSTPARADRVMAILNELQLSDEEHHHAGPAAEH